MDINKQVLKLSRLSQAKARSANAQAQSAEVEAVLEHVSSPYRWELLDIPPVKPDESQSAQNNPL